MARLQNQHGAGDSESSESIENSDHSTELSSKQYDALEALYDACVVRDWDAVIVQCGAISKFSADIEWSFRDKRNKTCLYVALDELAPCRVIRAILDAHKESLFRIAGEEDDFGKTPLHLAAVAVRFAYQHDDAVAIVEMLLENDPKAVAALDWEGYTPLHRLLVDKGYPSQQYFREDEFPLRHKTPTGSRDLNEKDATKIACARILLNASTTKSILSHAKAIYETPLHTACKRCDIPDMAKLSLEHCPQAALAKDLHGDTPLHLAARNQGYVDFDCANIALLLESLATQGQSEAAAVNNSRHTPLHYAIMCCADERVTKMLVDAQPESTCVKDEKKKTPLDLVQDGNADDLQYKLCELGIAEYKYVVKGKLDVKQICEKCNLLIKAMLSVRHGHGSLTWNESLWMTTEQASTGNEECSDHAFIHNYLRLGPECPLDLVLILARLYPHQAQMKDPRGDLPLHIALENGAQHASLKSPFSSRLKPADRNGSILIKTLIDIFPQAARVPFRNGDLPFNLLLQSNEGKSGWHHGVQTLVRAHPGALLYGKSELLPTVLAVILSKVGEEEDLSALYEFMREMPLVVLGHVSPNQRLRGVVQTTKL